MIYSDSIGGSIFGAITGFISAIGFAVYTVTIRWRPETPKFTTVVLAGIFCAIFLINFESFWLIFNQFGKFWTILPPRTLIWALCGPSTPDMTANLPKGHPSFFPPNIGMFIEKLFEILIFKISDTILECLRHSNSLKAPRNGL